MLEFDLKTTVYWLCNGLHEMVWNLHNKKNTVKLKKQFLIVLLFLFSSKPLNISI